MSDQRQNSEYNEHEKAQQKEYMSIESLNYHLKIISFFYLAY